MLDRRGRDEMHYKIAHINIPLFENKEEVLEAMKNINNPNFQDKDGRSYLHSACGAHSIEAIRILLDLGADPNINDKDGFSPVTEALGRNNENNPAILDLMLQYGLNLSKIERDQTLKEWIEMFDDDELNEIVKKHCK